MDNFRIDILAEGGDTLREAIGIAIKKGAPGGRITHYEIARIGQHETDDLRWSGRASPLVLILFWSEDKSRSNILPLMFPAGPAEVYELVRGWLASLKAEDLGPEPDHDGSNGRAWRLYNEAWGHVDGSHYAVCAIQPCWAMYGK